ncbi:Aliphatic sulfonates import ATP-binding protein SsuB [Corynebacterium deserti GIMN1.010]|uniref:Aliphatic sulfonates import ATP-binding protein SsuB n=1 Tax=Corynebacterium deserti GIMN1.010 TaxID=931089 RepID=A0A0M5IU63_9CORY|nr:ABC transporter ATP-binding protein [Corynebacterium deserti]ALC05618.1 Aliphatic sulfonates import ATP-binding protein SsuB [Corynebacterium deserti GIMN1.010]
MTATLSLTPAASVAELRKSYGSKEVLRGINLTIERGEIVALIGRSGSGKSTILRVLAGLSKEHSGEISVSGNPAVAFQEPRLFPWKTVVENVAFGLNHTTVSFHEALKRASALLSEVNLPDSDKAWPLTLSGGQAQRVSLARALISEPDLLLLDEPFGALDALTRLSAQDLLLRIASSRNVGVLLVTHDVGEAIALADRVILLDDGNITHTLDVTIPTEREHRRTHPSFGEHTAQLLEWLEITNPS